jgi:hypothetical protein
MSGFPMPTSHRVWDVGERVVHVPSQSRGVIREVVPGSEREHPWADYLALVWWDEAEEASWVPMQHLWGEGEPDLIEQTKPAEGEK